METLNYLQWLVRETPTTWWHDSADPDEIRQALAYGATGVTTNPLLTSRTLRGRPEIWADALRLVSKDLPAERRAEELMSHVVRRAARAFGKFILEGLNETVNRFDGAFAYLFAVDIYAAHARLGAEFHELGAFGGADIAAFNFQFVLG